MKRLFAASGALIVGLAALPGSALAGPPDHAQNGGAGTEVASVQVVSADGTVSEAPCVQVSRDRVECLDDAGRGLVGVVNIGPPPKDAVSGGIAPASATGTNGRVLIKVVGSGLYVDSWQTRARQFPSDGCIDHDAYFYHKLPSWSTYQLTTAYLYYGPCYQVPSYAWSIDWWTYGDQGQAGGYVNQTRLCNAWSPAPPLSGFPCITVHD